MANYIFETMTSDQAASFTASDYLIFLNGTAASVTPTDHPAAGLSVETITLTSTGRNDGVTFRADQLSGASTAGHFVFSSGDDYLGLGSSANNTITAGGSAGSTARLYGFGGNDVLTGSVASDTIFGGSGNDTISGANDVLSGTHTSHTDTDYLFGGAGADSIVGSASNDHIYGYDNFSAASLLAADGNDIIDAGAGKDYVQGNGGADSIFGGADNDHLYGGAGNDTLIGGDGWDYLQGNTGADSLVGGEGFDTLRGGADADTLDGGAGADSLLGDAGNDVIIGGTDSVAATGNDDATYSHDTLTGGAGQDTFVFATGDALFDTTTGATTGTTDLHYDLITDYVHGEDHLQITGFDGSATGFTILTDSGASFTSVESALTYAQGLLDGHTAATPEVAALHVSGDTFLFYVSGGATSGDIDSIIDFHGNVTFTTADFVTA